MTTAVRQPDLSVYADFLGLPSESFDTKLTTQYLINGPIYADPELTIPIGGADFKCYSI